MRIVADEKIPLLSHFFGKEHEIILKNGRHLQRAELQGADILLIRSITPVNAALLAGTKIQFVGSLAAGMDHLDTSFLSNSGIPFATASGANATAVAEYIIACMAYIHTQHVVKEGPLRAGVIGVGHIGKKIAALLEKFGYEVLLSDPIRKEQENDFPHTPHEEWENLDMITLHTPLTRTGPYPTFHLLDPDFFARQNPRCICFNTARGGVINQEKLFAFPSDIKWCIDVWENEPTLSIPWLNQVCIGTPHIAGHSVQSKWRAMQMIYESAVNAGILKKGGQDPLIFPRSTVSCAGAQDWRQVVLRVFNPKQQTDTLKSNFLTQGDKAFDLLRNAFQKSEFAYVDLMDLALDTNDLHFLGQLGFHV